MIHGIIGYNVCLNDFSGTTEVEISMDILDESGRCFNEQVLSTSELCRTQIDVSLTLHKKKMLKSIEVEPNVDEQ